MSKQPERGNKLRARANEILEDITDIPNLDSSSIDELIHELHSYHTELEIQNQQLQRAHQELLQSQEQYKTLFESMPVTYLILNEEGIVLKANPSAGKQFNCEIKEIEGHRLEQFIAPEYQDVFYKEYRMIKRGEIKHLSEMQFVRRDNTRFHGLIEGERNEFPNKEATIHLTITDISQRLRYQNRLQGSRELDQAVLMATNVQKIISLALKYLLKLTHCVDVHIVFFHPDTLFIYEFSQKQDDAEMNVVIEPKAEELDALPIFTRIESKIPETDDLLKIPIFQSEMQIGYLGLREARGHSFTDEVIEISQDIARQLGIAIQHARLLEKVTHHAQELEVRVDQRTRELHESQQQEHIQRVFAEAMLDTSRILNSTLDLDQVLQRVFVNLEKVIGYDTAEIILLENNTATFAKRQSKGRDIPRTVDLNMDISNIPPYKHILETGKKLWVDDLEIIKTWRLSGLPESIKSYLGVPLRYDDGVLGILNIYMRQSQPFGALKKHYLEVFAEQATLAIKNVHQHYKEQKLAVLEERQRLARDLHDSVSQMLFSLTTLSETLVNNSDENSDILHYIVNLARGAQAEMRLLLFELNPKSFEDTTLWQLLEKLVLGFKGHTQRRIELKLDKEAVLLPVDVKLHLFRIAQEALHNVLKHTSKGDVMIHLQKQNNRIHLVIEDKGEGFDHQVVQRRGRGLMNMRERAEQIGADFAITSIIGDGTQVRVVLPLG